MVWLIGLFCCCLQIDVFGWMGGCMCTSAYVQMYSQMSCHTPNCGYKGKQYVINIVKGKAVRPTGVQEAGLFYASLN